MRSETIHPMACGKSEQPLVVRAPGEQAGVIHTQCRRLGGPYATEVKEKQSPVVVSGHLETGDCLDHRGSGCVRCFGSGGHEDPQTWTIATLCDLGKQHATSLGFLFCEMRWTWPVPSSSDIVRL